MGPDPSEDVAGDVTTDYYSASLPVAVAGALNGSQDVSDSSVDGCPSPGG